MILKTNRIIQIMKRKRIDKPLLLQICCILITAAFLAGFFTYDVSAADGIKLYDCSAKRTTVYSDKQVKISYNGSIISSLSTPGILVDGIAIVPYDDIFLNSPIGADCNYDEKKGTISISKYNKTITMTIGSKKAFVNGKAVIMTAAPKKIKYTATDITKILVPSRFVAETLGLEYTWNSASSTVSIAKNSIQLSYNGGQSFVYSGAQGKVSIDGKKVDLGGMPSIITNNTAMLCAKKVFSESKIGADYSYDTAKKTVTLKKGSKTLVMTIGSTKALLNKKSVKLDTAPMLVTNHDTETTYVMVPGSVTAASLGYRYSWNNKTKTSEISSTSNATASETKNSNSSPELGDSSVVNEAGTILGSWFSDDSTFYQGTGIHELNTGAAADATGNIYYVARDNSTTKKNAETFLVLSTTPFSSIKADNNGTKLTISAKGLGCTQQSYPMYGVSSNYVNTVSVANNSDNSCVDIQFDLIYNGCSYDISISPDNLILYVTVYQDAVTSAVIGKNSAGDYLTLTGIKKLKPVISEQDGLMYIELSNAVNCLGDATTAISGADYITQFVALAQADKTRIILSLKEGNTYYTMENGNQYTISFQKPPESNTAEEEQGSTDSSNESNSSGNDQSSDAAKGDMPVAGEISQYEVIIPKPADLSWTLVEDEDYYYNNYFVIKLPGDYKAYYSENCITKNSPVIDMITVSVSSSSQTVIKIATNKLQGYEIAFDESNIYINLGDPRDIYKNIVVLDPGHGGAATGAQYYSTFEKDVNFKILYTIGKKYFYSDSSKLKVYYTRTSDSDLGLSERADFVKRVGADLFVSLHMNASEANYVYGTEVFYSRKNNSANCAGLTSAKLATLLVNNLTKNLGSHNRGVKEEAYTVIHKNTVPAVLIELGFLSNKTEHSLLMEDEYQNNAAKIIYETLIKVFEAYPTGR